VRFSQCHVYWVLTCPHRRQRGLHNISDEIRFPSRPGFVFHDSRGFEAGSSEELSTVRKFVEDRSSTVSKLWMQLHAIWYERCFKLNSLKHSSGCVCRLTTLASCLIRKRNLSVGSREPVSNKKLLTGLHFYSHIAPLVVIFTKRDGAVDKVTSQIIQDNSSSSGGTISRSFKKQARAKAEIEVTECVERREEELKQLSEANSAVAFLTTSGTVSWLSPVENC